MFYSCHSLQPGCLPNKDPGKRGRISLAQTENHDRGKHSSGQYGSEVPTVLSFGYSHIDFLQVPQRPFPAFLLACSPLSWRGFWRRMLQPARASILCKHWHGKGRRLSPITHNRSQYVADKRHFMWTLKGGCHPAVTMLSARLSLSKERTHRSTHFLSTCDLGQGCWHSVERFRRQKATLFLVKQLECRGLVCLLLF